MTKETFKKEMIKETAASTIAVLVWLAICFTIVYVFGSCGVHHEVEATGKTIVITNDTTVVNHGGYINLKIQK